MPDTVRAEIVLPRDAPRGAAQVVVRVEDVSRADAPSTVLAEQCLRFVALPEGGVLEVEVDVPGELVDPRRTYAVSVHVDVSGSGEVERGDLVSTQSHPVLTRGAGRAVRVPVRMV